MSNDITVSLALKATPFPAALNTLVHIINAAEGGTNAVKLTWEDVKELDGPTSARLMLDGETITGEGAALQRLADKFTAFSLNGSSDAERQEVNNGRSCVRPGNTYDSVR